MKSKIIVFSCNWNGWSCIDTAISSGFHYPPSVKLIRVSCLSRIHSGLILKAFELGAEGIMLLGCEPGSCHFGVADDCVNKEYIKTREIMYMLGIPGESLDLVQLPAFDGSQFIARITRFIDTLDQSALSRRGKQSSTGLKK